MELEALAGRYARLRRELAAAYQELPWQSSRIDRIADDLAQAERELLAAERGQGSAALSGQH
ncbi:hypothetical protein G8A07_05275 [Roseateles sp. DAIF2]|uniref:hypothetical protein n=1 Tax=Roseateles sp. DAIF2 TaxID=2714952 RepID=UPI0018A31CD4|nr:hypothetical protein [Roseateles sp. DAIF2]QPF72402.1 hypothetical protein G8A07_05275 [Roseateles sp. DAIF2]